jgi:hypothetical protein
MQIYKAHPGLAEFTFPFGETKLYWSLDRYSIPYYRDNRTCPSFDASDTLSQINSKEDKMASWNISGQYVETCNCDYVCPCILANLTAKPTEGDCKAAIAMRIDKGAKDGVSLDGLAFVVLLHAPGVMSDGNIKVGLIVDDKANEAQAAAIGEIATGAAGGPMAALGPLVGEVAGIERRPIKFEQDGMKYSVTAGDLLDQAVEGVPSAVNENEPIYLENTCHPVSSKLALAHATRSKIHAFGIDWDDASGTRNGHFTKFAWAG